MHSYSNYYSRAHGDLVSVVLFSQLSAMREVFIMPALKILPIFPYY